MQASPESMDGSWPGMKGLRFGDGTGTASLEQHHHKGKIESGNPSK